MFAWYLTVGCILFALLWPGTPESGALTHLCLPPNSSTLHHACGLVGNNFFKKKEWTSSLNFACRVFSPVFIAFWFSLSGNLLPVLIFSFSSCCSYCFSKCRYHSFLLFWFYHSLIGNVWHDLRFLWPSEDKHLFAHVLTICFASFVICLFLSFTEFYIGIYFCFFLVIFKISLRFKVSAFLCFLTH